MLHKQILENVETYTRLGLLLNNNNASDSI